MGQRQSTGSSGTAVSSGAARYRQYASSLTVDAGSAAAGSNGSGRISGMPSSASATPDHHHQNYGQRSVGAVSGRLRALSLGNFPGTSSSGTSRSGPIGVPSDIGAIAGASSPDSDDDSTDDGGGLFGALTAVSSLPSAHLAFYRGVKLEIILICVNIS